MDWVHGSGGPQPSGGLRVHGGPRATVAEWLAGVCAQGGSDERKLTDGRGKGRGDLRDPHRRQMGAVQRRWCPDVDEWRQRCVELGGRATRARVERIDARAGTVVWRRCSRMAFIGWGMTGGGRSRSNRRRLGGTSMAKPFRVGRKWGGETGSRGRGTAAPIHFAMGEEGSASVAEGENERRPSGIDARTKGLAGGIGAATTLVEGCTGWCCSRKKKVKAAFRFFTLFRMGGGNRQGTTGVRSAGPRG
jgi:hypothetical protein